jgi:uncharacterized repeat protein (TIGR03803 family)
MAAGGQGVACAGEYPQRGQSEGIMHRNIDNCLVILALAAAAAAPLESARAGKATVLYSFSGGSDGSVPAAGLIAGKAGNFYGTTYAGGSSGYGAVFELAPDGSETALYSFGGGSDGEYPQSGLVQDAQGNLYGTTFEGGSDGLGTVFKLAADGTETVLHSFTGAALTRGGPYDGAYPMGGLIVDAKGDLYGTTETGGSNYGTVFEISADGQERILHTFAGSPDGAYLLATLTPDGSGNLFGTTLGGGVQSNYCGVGCGAVFELSPKGKKSWTETVICSFQGEGNDTTNPWANVIEDSAGNLFGTATLGGDYNDCESGGCGAVFELSPDEDDICSTRTPEGRDAAGAVRLYALPGRESCCGYVGALCDCPPAKVHREETNRHCKSFHGPPPDLGKTTCVRDANRS